MRQQGSCHVQCLLILALLLTVLSAFRIGPAYGEYPTKLDPTIVSLKSRSFTPSPGIEPALEDSLTSRPTERRHVIVQFESASGQEGYRASLEAMGVVFHDPLPAMAWLATVDGEVVGQSLSAAGVRSISFLLPEDRIDPDLLSAGPPPYAIDANGNLLLSVDFFEDVPDASVLALLSQLGASVLQGPMMLHDWDIAVPPAQLSSLMEADAVRWIETVNPPALPKLDGLRPNMKVEETWTTYSITGSGIITGMWEAGSPTCLPDINSAQGATAQVGHDDFWGPCGKAPLRITAVECTGRSDHATGVAGTLLGTGFSSNLYGNGGVFNQWTGVAPTATMFSWSAGNAADEHQDGINNKGILLSNHSWGFGECLNTGDVDLGGKYNHDADKFDKIITKESGYDRAIPVMFAAGNERRKPNGNLCGTDGYRTLNNGPQASKNTITVGAILSDNDASARFSSAGPTEDKRIKPDCVAPGDESPEGGAPSIKMPDADEDEAAVNDYQNDAGTSYATPAVSGAVGLLIQDYQAQNGSIPRPATVKALLLCAARDIGNPGPDYRMGYGAINALETIAGMRAKAFKEDDVATGQTDEIILAVPANSPKLRVTLVWDDPAAAANALPTLINDLDLRLVEPGTNNVKLPWILDPDNPANNATTGDDARNNVEQVEVSNPAAGNWKIRVTGFSVVKNSPQKYTVCWQVKAPPGTPPPPTLDPTHYWTYQIAPIDTAQNVLVKDQFLPDYVPVTLDRMERLVNWVQKDYSTVRDTSLHFTWWNLEPKIPMPRELTIDNQFVGNLGDSIVTVDSLAFMLVPARKNDPTPYPPYLSHYLCYKASSPSPYRDVWLRDEWRYLCNVAVDSVCYFCNPAWKYHPGIGEYAPIDTVTHLTLYTVTSSFDTTAYVRDQFVEGVVDVMQRPPEYLLVPTFKKSVFEPPTAVFGLLSLSALPNEASIQIRWDARSREEYVGFYVLRSTDGTSFARMNADMIPNVANEFPATFTWTDVTAAEGVLYSYRIEVIYPDGTPETWDRTITAEVLGRAPATFAFRITGPNPFRAKEGTGFEYAVPRPGAIVSIAVYDVSGRRLATLVEGRVEAGTRAAAWRGPELERLASGIYFLRMEAGDFKATERVVLLK